MLTMKHELSLRALGLGLGAMANLVALALAYDAMSIAEFGQLAVALNCALLIQALDMGVVPAITNATARADGDGIPRLRWVPALIGTSLAISAITFLLTSVVFDLVEWWLQLWTLSAAALSRLAGGLSAILIGLGETGRYYGVMLLQPIAILVSSAGAFYLEASPAGFAVSIVLSGAVPGIAAGFVLDRRRKVINSASSRVVVRFDPVLGLRQVTGLIGFATVPIVAAWAGGDELAAEYAVPFRLYLSAWAVVGVVYMRNWSAMVREVRVARHGARVGSVNRQGLVLAVPLASGVVAIAHPLATTIGEELDDRALVFASAMAAALVLRSMVLGSSLALQAGAATVPLAALELVLVALGIALPIWTGVLPLEMQPAASLGVATVMSFALLRVWAKSQGDRHR